MVKDITEKDETEYIEDTRVPFDFSFSEAPASANLQVSMEGYSMQFTIRDISETALLARVKKMIRVFNEMGAKPEIRRVYGEKKEKVFADYKCPECGGNVVIITTKTGKVAHQCENRKYDFSTKQTSGCSYIKWIEDNTPTPRGVQTAAPRSMQTESQEEPATEAQERVLKSTGLWVDRLTKLQASKLIAEGLAK